MQLHSAQKALMERFDVAEIVDVHCHILPGLDDGPSDISESIALCQALVEDGVTTVFATPHQLGCYDRLNSAEMIQLRINELTSELHNLQIPLQVLSGGDVRIDERLARLLDIEEIIPLGGIGAHLLVELPHQMLVDPVPTIEMLCGRAIQPIVTHPERHPYLAGKEELLTEWVRRGAIVQLTAGSLLGEFGRRAHRQAWELLERGLAHVIATDAHSIHRRPPRMTQALETLEEAVGSHLARVLCIDNPLLVRQGSVVPSNLSLSTDA